MPNWLFLPKSHWVICMFCFMEVTYSNFCSIEMVQKVSKDLGLVAVVLWKKSVYLFIRISLFKKSHILKMNVPYNHSNDMVLMESFFAMNQLSLIHKKSWKYWRISKKKSKTFDIFHKLYLFFFGKQSIKTMRDFWMIQFRLWLWLKRPP